MPARRRGGSFGRDAPATRPKCRLNVPSAAAGCRRESGEERATTEGTAGLMRGRSVVVERPLFAKGVCRACEADASPRGLRDEFLI